MTERFVATAVEMATLQGLPEYPFAVIPHPIAGAPDAELRARAEESVDTIVKLLTAGERSPAA
jgi:hypothetical protein